MKKEPAIEKLAIRRKSAMKINLERSAIQQPAMKKNPAIELSAMK